MKLNVTDILDYQNLLSRGEHIRTPQVSHDLIKVLKVFT